MKPDRPPPASIRRVALARRACLLPSTSFGIIDLFLGKWFWAGINGFVVIVLGYLGERSYRRLKDEYRRTARDRNYPGASAGPLARTRPTGAFTTFETSTGTSSRIAQSTADLPIIAYKTADLTIRKGGPPRLRSHFTGWEYNGADRAFCRKTSGQTVRDTFHRPPILDCACGFYAVNTFDRVQREYGRMFGAVLLEVELFGKVIVHEYGYRAERQRILHVGLPSCFFTHTTEGCKVREPEALVVGHAHTDWDFLLPVCAYHLSILMNVNVRPPSSNPSVEVIVNDPPYAFLASTSPVTSYTFEQISAELHIPVGPARDGF